MGAYDSLEDLSGSLHLLSAEQLKELAGKIEEILDKHEEALHPQEDAGQEEPTPLEDFEFADDMSAFAALASELDRRGFYEAADEIDELLKKTAAKQKKPGRSFAQWMRQLKKMQASQKVIDKFRKSYKGALDHAKKKKNYKADRAEEYAMRTAVDGLPKKYLKEPSKVHGPAKRGPIQKADDALTAYYQTGVDIDKLRKLTPQQLREIVRTKNPMLAKQLIAEYYAEQSKKPAKGDKVQKADTVKSRKEELLDLFAEFGENPYGDEMSRWEEELELEEKEPASLWDTEQEADDATDLAAKLNLDINKLRRLTPQQLQSLKRIQNPGLARQWAEHYARQPAQQPRQPAQQPAQQPRQPTPAAPAAPAAPAQQRPTMAPAQAPAAPAQAPAVPVQAPAVPVQAPAGQPRPTRKFDLDQWEKNMGFGQGRPGPGEITDADMQGSEITEETLRQPTQEDFPPAATRRDFPPAATREDLFGRGR